MSISFPTIDFTTPMSDEEIKRHRLRMSETGTGDCLRISISLPEEGLYDGTTTCIHERLLMGPPGTIEQFAGELDKLIARFCHTPGVRARSR